MPTPFYIVNAFTTEASGGNPAVAIFVDDLQDTATMQSIAANFNQPMVAFLRRTQTTPPDETVAQFDVRWFTPSEESPICGHATLASSGLLFSDPTLLPPSVTSIHFRATSGRVLTAKKSGDFVQISLPSTLVTAPPPDEAARLKAIVVAALGGGVKVKYLGVGGEGFEQYLLVEIDEADDLSNLPFDASALMAAAPKTRVFTVTSTSSDPEIAFISRMFAPASGVAEDHVCGSAHCLLTPYWTQKLGRQGEELLAKQVSKRGGLLKVQYLEKEGRVTLAGPTKATMKGDLLL